MRVKDLTVFFLVVFSCFGSCASMDLKTYLTRVLNTPQAHDRERAEQDILQALKEKQDAYEAAKENEQSLANRTLTAATIAATGIGGMELARGLSEQKADKAAEQDMAAYIETFRCEYGNGKQVKAGPDEIELPGGNDETFMKLRSEYMALAADLKERKLALGMKPGIESEEILDKSQMGLYDDENIGIESGAYSSFYRAQMLNSEEDQAKIDEDAKKSKARVIGGGIAAGVGVVGSIVGNLLINGVGKRKQLNNEITEIKINRDKVTSELYNYLQSEIDTCNEKIQKNKKLVDSIKTSQSAAVLQNKNVEDYINKVESTEPLQGLDDIIKLKDHPLCD